MRRKRAVRGCPDTKGYKAACLATPVEAVRIYTTHMSYFIPSSCLRDALPCRAMLCHIVVIVTVLIDNSLMKMLRIRFLPVLALLLAFAGTAVLVPGQAVAREQDGASQSDRLREREQRRLDRRPPRDAGEAARQLAPRYGRLPDLPGPMDGQADGSYDSRSARGDQNVGRLSPEERRELRREIFDAGQEVYRSPGRSSQAPGRRER